MEILLTILATFGGEKTKVRTGAKNIFNLPDENLVEPWDNICKNGRMH